MCISQSKENKPVVVVLVDGLHAFLIRRSEFLIRLMSKVNIIKAGRFECETFKEMTEWDESPGLVVMGGGSSSEGHGFKYWPSVLDGHDIFHIDLL